MSYAVEHHVADRNLSVKAFSLSLGADYAREPIELVRVVKCASVLKRLARSRKYNRAGFTLQPTSIPSALAMGRIGTQMRSSMILIRVTV